jgi:hypothetical protein
MSKNVNGPTRNKITINPVKPGGTKGFTSSAPPPKPTVILPKPTKDRR